MSSSYRLSLDRWLATLKVEAGSVLDIGGAQLPLPKRVKTWDVKKYLIADLHEPHADSPKPDIEFDLNKTYQSPLQYDLIFCLEVFDYIYDPVTAMDNIRHCLKPGAGAWVTFPSVYPLHQPIDDDALRYMPGGIRKLAEAVNLEIIQMIPRKPETRGWQDFYKAERMRAAKHQDHDFIGWIVEFKK